MSKNKNFKSSNNPSMSFISKESAGDIEEALTEKIAPTNKRKVPVGYKPNPLYIETKSKRLQILIQPSIYEAVKAKAKAEEISTNEAINVALRQYVERR